MSRSLLLKNELVFAVVVSDFGNNSALALLDDCHGATDF